MKPANFIPAPQPIIPIFFSMKLTVDILGWIASVLIVGSYLLNIKGKWTAQMKPYIWCNLIGGIFFVANTFYYGAYPSGAVNVIWVIIAVIGLFQKPRKYARRQTGNNDAGLA